MNVSGEVTNGNSIDVSIVLFCLFVRFGSFIPFPEVSADLQRYTALKNLPKTHVVSGL